MSGTVNISRGLGFPSTLALVVVFGMPMVAAEQTGESFELTFQKAIAEIVCRDQTLIDASGMDYESCLDTGEMVTLSCWEGIRPLIPRSELLQKNYAEVDKDLPASMAFAMEKCLQASILMRRSSAHSNSTNSMGSSESIAIQIGKSGNPTFEKEWANIIADAGAQYAQRKDLVKRMSENLESDNLASVSLLGQDRMLAFRNNDDGSPVQVTEELPEWMNSLSDNSLRFVMTTRWGVVVAVGDKSIVDRQEIDVSYTSYFQPDLPQCEPSLRELPCGSCEIGRFEDSRAVLSWQLSDIAPEGKIVDMNEYRRDLEACWREGMSKIGYSDIPF